MSVIPLSFSLGLYPGGLWKYGSGYGPFSQMLETEADGTTKSKPNKETYLSISNLKPKIYHPVCEPSTRSVWGKEQLPSPSLPIPQSGGGRSELNLKKSLLVILSDMTSPKMVHF